MLKHRRAAQTNPEVIFVIRDAFWELFCDTGEPMCWLMHRARDAAVAGKKAAQSAPERSERNTAGR